MPGEKVAIAFWIFVAIASVAGIIGDYKKRRLRLEPLRLAIEKGQPLDPALVEKLLAQEKQDDAMDPVSLQVGGIITLSAGIGVALLSWFIAQLSPKALYPILGCGVVTVCVGAGLIIAARTLVQSRQARQQADGSAG